jgi:hypothetical protein
MQTPEEFMRDYLREHIEDEKRELASREPFRKRFFTDECFFDSRSGTLRMWESEVLLSVSRSDTGATAITKYEMRTHTHKHRYHLLQGDRGWLIQCVDMGCPFCNEKVQNSSCRFCHGTGWRSGNPDDPASGGETKTSIPPTFPPSHRF